MASLFLDFPCGKKDNLTNVKSVAWCKSEAICAVATNDGCIRFYGEEGVSLNENCIERKCEATSLAWQPRGRVLATGWEDGHVATYEITNGVASGRYSGDSEHSRFCLSVVHWNATRTRLVSCDVNGRIIVWKAEIRGDLTELKQYDTGGSAVRQALFCPVLIIRGEKTGESLMARTIVFVGTERGTLIVADDLGESRQVQNLGESVEHLLFYEQERRLVVLTRGAILAQLRVSEDGKLIPVMTMKLSVAGNGSIRQVCWAGPGLLAAATGESMIRFFNLNSDDSYVVPLASSGLEKSDKATAIAFNPLQRFLAVGSQSGRVAMWRFAGEYAISAASDQSGIEDWEAMPATASAAGGQRERSSSATIEILAWGPGQGLLAAASAEGKVSMLSETVLHRMLKDDVGLIQLATDTVRAERQNGAMARLTTDISIRGLAVASSHIVAWNGAEARVYEWSLAMNDLEPRRVASFATNATAVGIREDTIFRTAQDRVELCNLHGVVKQKISFSQGEGVPAHLDLNGSYLAVVTDTGLIKIFQVDRREPKQIGSPGHFELDGTTNAEKKRKLSSFTDRGTDARAVRSIKCNADGTRVSILADKVHGTSIKIREPDSNLYVYDADRDLVDSHTFGKRYPISHYWDPIEPKLLACETRALRGADTSLDKALTSPSSRNAPLEYTPLGLGGASAKNEEKISFDHANKSKCFRSNNSTQPVLEVSTLFVTSEHGILLQDVFGVEPPLEALLGVQVPRLFFTRGGSAAQKESRDEAKSLFDENNESRANEVALCSRLMRDFAGLDDADEQTRAALLDFSYYLTIGNMDEAHKAVRLIKSSSVWENMAHMCVKTKRLDVAEVCLGNMGHARGSAALRLAKSEAPELEARVAALAIQLGLRDDAARLYTECKRYDLLNSFYQAAGEWALALETAQNYDRIHLKATHHRYACHLESKGEYDAAARHYELAETHRREVPRMLVKQGENAALERYIMRSKDAELLKWWAGYCESLGHLDSAKTCYEFAGDAFNLVRVACHEDDVQLAKQLVEASANVSTENVKKENIDEKTPLSTLNGDAAAAYHLARHLESRGDIKEAIQYLAKSGCYDHAIRLARRYGLDAELMRFCIKARPSLQIECAAYFERKGEYEKAVELYQQGGDLPRALELCFKLGGKGRTQMFEALAAVSKNLDASASPATLKRCADFFVQHEQFQDAVRLYATGGDYSQAILLCIQHQVPITEELAELLTPSVDNSNDAKNEHKAQPRNEVILELAAALKKQNKYQLAAKKYTQAGDRPAALRCLLKSGDTKNVIYYASTSRNRDIYILAANYLQSLDWQSGDAKAKEITKKIVEFYTKAKAYDKLAEFYDNFAQMEIDEYRDYDKALKALQQSRQQLEKVPPKLLADRDRRISALDTRISLIADFVEARSLERTDPDRMALLINNILTQRHDLDSAIRVGDAFALLIEYKAQNKLYDDAYALIQDMRQRKIALHPYIEQELLDRIHRAVGVDFAGATSSPDSPMHSPTDGRQSKHDDIVDELVEDASEDEIEDEVPFSPGTSDDEDESPFHSHRGSHK